MDNLVTEVKSLMNRGVYDPEKIFKAVYPRHRVHYSRVREAIHAAKTE